MAKVPDSSPIPKSFLFRGLAGFLLYILSLASASGNWLYLMDTVDGKPVFHHYATGSVR
jgi:hypothetical protein